MGLAGLGEGDSEIQLLWLPHLAASYFLLQALIPNKHLSPQTLSQQLFPAFQRAKMVTAQVNLANTSL